MFSLLSIGLAFFIIAVSPGPGNISNATIAMTRGRKISLIYGAGLSTGLLFWGIVAASGLGIVLQSSVYLLMSFKIFGGIYLIWLAFLSGREAIHPNDKSLQVESDSKSYLGWFIRGVILNVSNPKTVIAWMAALSVGLGSNDNLTALLLGVIVCLIVGFVTNALYSVLFSFNGVMAWYQSTSRWINTVVTGLFLASGVGLIRSAFIRETTS